MEAITAIENTELVSAVWFIVFFLIVLAIPVCKAVWNMGRTS